MTLRTEKSLSKEEINGNPITEHRHCSFNYTSIFFLTKEIGLFLDSAMSEQVLAKVVRGVQPPLP